MACILHTATAVGSALPKSSCVVNVPYSSVVEHPNRNTRVWGSVSHWDSDLSLFHALKNLPSF